MANSDPTDGNPQQNNGISRRDFLRRASKEAVQTGTKIVPGVGIATKALGISPDSAKTNRADGNKIEPQSLAGRFAAWRQRKQNSPEEKS